MSYGPYRVDVWHEPEGGWSAAVPDVDGAFTAGDSLAEVERNVRESIAVTLDLPRGAEGHMTIELRVTVDAGGPVDEMVAAARRAREAAASAVRATEEAVRELRGKGLSTRDVARLVGITAGRVSQLDRHVA